MLCNSLNISSWSSWQCYKCMTYRIESLLYMEVCEEVGNLIMFKDHVPSIKFAQFLDTKRIYSGRKKCFNFYSTDKHSFQITIKYLWEQNQNAYYVCFLIAAVNHNFIQEILFHNLFLLTVFVCFQREGCKRTFLYLFRLSCARTEKVTQ